MAASLALQGDVGGTGRPFRTANNGTVPLGNLELEVAGDLAFEQSDHRHVFPALWLKFGVVHRVEMGFEGGYSFISSEELHESGLAETTLTVRMRFYEGTEILPSTCATIGKTLPTVDRDITPSRDLGFLANGQLSRAFPAFT